MAEIDPYVQAYALRSIKQFGLSESFERQNVFFEHIAVTLHDLLDDLNASNVTDVEAISSQIFLEFVENGVIERRDVPFAGEYYRHIPGVYQNYRNNWLSNSEVHSQAQEIGSRYFPDVFSGYMSSMTGSDELYPDFGLAPAANRVVTFNDNQSADVSEKIDEVARHIEGKNSLEGPSGLKNLILGQMRASRELVLSGVVRWQILQLTLVEALRFIIERYEGEIVSTLASALLAEVLKLAGTVS